MTKMILSLLEKKRFRQIRRLFSRMKNIDLAALLSETEGREMAELSRLIPIERLAGVLSYMAASAQRALLGRLNDAELSVIINTLELDDAVDLIVMLPFALVKRLLKGASHERLTLLKRFLLYPKDSAGSIMTVEYTALRRDMSVGEALEFIRANAAQKQIDVCYIIDDASRLEGAVTAKRLLLSSPNERLTEIMDQNVVCREVTADQESVADTMKKYDLNLLPIVDSMKRLAGIVTSDDVFDVLDRETTEDIEKMAAISPTETSYLETGVLRHAGKRIPWLLFLMLSASVAGAIIAHYENAFSVMPVLVTFIPMLMDTGGNCGSQSATLIIRGLALHELAFQDFFRILFKEFRVSLLVGAVLALCNGVLIFFKYQSLLIAATIGMSLMATIMLAKLTGCFFPLVAKKCGLDPAIMAAPLITTVVDSCSVLLYFKIATALLPI